MQHPDTHSMFLMSDATPRDPLTTWHDDFKLQVTSLRQLLHLRTRTGDTSAREDMKPSLRDIADTVTHLEEAIAAVRGYLAAERDELARHHAFRASVAHQTQRIALIRAQLPPDVAAQLGLAGSGKENDSAVANSDRDSPRGPVAPATAVTNATATAPAVKTKKTGAAALPAGTSPKSTDALANRTKTAPKPRPNKAKTRAQPPAQAKALVEEPAEDSASADGPFVRAVSGGELAAAPQYVRGRLTIEKVDDVTKRLTAVARGKYALLGRPLKKLSSPERAHVDNFREAECDETYGLVFLTDGEIKGFGNMRIDANVKSVINMLRHVGSLKEIRGKNRSRVFIIN